MPSHSTSLRTILTLICHKGNIYRQSSTLPFTNLWSGKTEYIQNVGIMLSKSMYTKNSTSNWNAH